MTRTCKNEGCARIVQARGMCNTHYKDWWRKAEVKPSKPDPRKLILEAMPGTYRQLALETGFCYHTVIEVVRALRAEDMAHIGEIEPPRRGISGTKFMPIFWAGPGNDKRITRAMQVNHRRKASRETHALRMMVRRGDPLINAMAGRTA